MEDQVARANASGKVPVVFVHGLWLLPNSWERWVQKFEAAGYTALAPRWPGDPGSVARARANPNGMGGRSIGEVADAYETVIRGLRARPAVVGHSFGGLLTQILAGRGLAAVSVAIDPAPFRGIPQLPLSAVRSAWPVLRNPANRGRTVMLAYEQWRYAFTNAVPDDEAKRLYDTYAVPGAGLPVFQAATANLNPATEAKVNIKISSRGPLLIVSGAEDHTVPPVLAHAAFSRQSRNEGVTEYVAIEKAGHSLTIDHLWESVADAALQFVQRFAPAS